MKWKVLNTGPNTAAQNMALDQQLLNELATEQCGILHFYDWSAPSATFGYFVDPFKFLNKEAVSHLALQLARRPTGGGILFHLWDWAFSMLIPSNYPVFSVNTMDNYRFVNQIISETIREFSGGGLCPELLIDDGIPLDDSCRNFCMAKPTQYDVMIQGRKVGGGAQRRTRHGLLHQGTISLVSPSFEYLEKILLPKTQVIEAMKSNTCVLLQGSHTQQQILESKKELSLKLLSILKVN